VFSASPLSTVIKWQGTSARNNSDFAFLGTFAEVPCNHLEPRFKFAGGQTPPEHCCQGDVNVAARAAVQGEENFVMIC
jgi:hypothetical protein